MGFWDWIKGNKKKTEDVNEEVAENTAYENDSVSSVESQEVLNESPEVTEKSPEIVEESPEVTEKSSEIAEESPGATGNNSETLNSWDDSDDDGWGESFDGDWGTNWGEFKPEDFAEENVFDRLVNGLAKTRDNIVSGMDALFNSEEKIDEDFYDELEETLILGDLGVHTTEEILDKLKADVKSEKIKKKSDCKEFFVNTLKEIMNQGETAYEFEKVPSVVFIIGVNGVGKTTSIGKMAAHLKAMNKRVMMAACDTFRAAAGSQLEEWSHRAGVELIGGVEGQDPSSVLFDAVNAAVARNVDVLLVDTAGRLHNKKNLMDELKKMNKIIDKVCGDNLHRENLIVLDASTGQNALNQAKEFGEVADLTGIILTKMDGTAKGGIAIAIQSELGIPVKYIGVGEKIADLQKFNPDTFIDALFDINRNGVIDSLEDVNDDTDNQ